VRTTGQQVASEEKFTRGCASIVDVEKISTHNLFVVVIFYTRRIEHPVRFTRNSNHENQDPFRPPGIHCRYRRSLCSSGTFRWNDTGLDCSDSGGRHAASDDRLDSRHAAPDDCADLDGWHAAPGNSSDPGSRHAASGRHGRSALIRISLE
jgi:hypothetical protein